ncbi:MAG: hypothetical protein ACK5XG_14940 [Burkholderiales bacterium]
MAGRRPNRGASARIVAASRNVARLVLFAAFAGVGAAHAQGEGSTEPLDVAATAPGVSTKLRAPAVLPEVDANAPMDVARARTLQDAVKIAREDADDTLTRERIACYRTFFVNRCLADVRVRQRQVESRLDRIEVAVNRTLREADALELNRRAAQVLAEREERADADAARREENRRAYEARTASAEAERVQREAEAPELERRAAANRAERERRESENAQRRVDAERRAGGDPERAAARERELAARRRETEAREARDATQRARRREEAARREEEAARRVAQREASGRRPVGGAKAVEPVVPVR